MSANQACFPIAAMARVLGVSKAGYYAWLQRPPSARATADAALLKRIKTVHPGSWQTYGAPRVHADLHGHGERHSRKRIARLMREAGLVSASHRRAGPTTTRRNKDDRPVPDLVDRDFNAAGTEPAVGRRHHLCADRSSGLRPAGTRSTICRRNSGEYGGRVLGIGSTSGERLRVSTKPGQSQYKTH